MRISDWSSDVCSSDLLDIALDGRGVQAERLALLERLQREEDRAGVGGVGEGCDVEAGKAGGLQRAWLIEDEPGSIVDHPVGGRPRGARRQLLAGGQAALVMLRDGAGGGMRELHTGPPRQCGRA